MKKKKCWERELEKERERDFWKVESRENKKGEDGIYGYGYTCVVEKNQEREKKKKKKRMDDRKKERKKNDNLEILPQYFHNKF